MRQKILHQILNLSQLSGRVEQSRVQQKKAKCMLCTVLHALYGVTKLTSYNLVSEPKKKIQIVQKCNWRRSRSFLAMETEPQAIVSSAHHRSHLFFVQYKTIDIVHQFFTETILWLDSNPGPLSLMYGALSMSHHIVALNWNCWQVHILYSINFLNCLIMFINNRYMCYTFFLNGITYKLNYVDFSPKMVLYTLARNYICI